MFYVLCVWVSELHMCVRYLWRPEETIRSLGGGITECETMEYAQAFWEISVYA